jgi:plastocyanin
MRRWLPAVLAGLAALALSGCTGDGYAGRVKDGVREVEIHIGWNEDRTRQYLEPKEIKVRHGEKVRFVVVNDDDPDTDYNGAKSGKDNFHDVALLDYDGDGDGIPEDIEHEVPAGRTASTELKGNPWFVATTKGRFTIICEVRTDPTHAALGMNGALIVE